MKIVFATISLHNMAGGLERNIVRVANHMAELGHEIALITFDLPHAVSFYPLDPRITWYRTGHVKPHMPINFGERLSLITRMRAAIRGGDNHLVYVVAFHHGILIRLFLASLFLKVKIICSERNSLSIYDYVSRGKWNLNFLMLTLVERITVQFERYKQDYPAFLRSRILHVPNVVEPATSLARPDKSNAHKRYRILSVGRICDQKNYEVLLQAFAPLARQFPQWDIEIVGDGDSKEKIEQLADDLNISERVFFPGTTTDMAKVYTSAHIFCMPSKWEGFPNAMAEAMAHGLPSVGFKECAGVCDLIQDGKTGLLVEGNGNETALRENLATLMDNASLRAFMGQEAISHMKIYSAARIFPLWEKLFPGPRL